MTTLSQQQVYALARSVGLSPYAAVIATAVAQAESGLRTDAVGDVGLEDGTWGPSVGLWQIRSLKAQTGTGQPRDVNQLADPTFNAHSMAAISGAGKNFSPWSTYTSGAYKKFTSAGAQAALSEGDNPASTSGSAIGELASGFLNTIGLGGATSGAVGAGGAISGLTSSWGNDALKIALYVVAGGSAAALVVVGAVHTVSEKG